MNGGYRYRSDDLARVLGAWGSALGDRTSAHVEGSVLELRRRWDRRLVGGWVAAAVILAGALALAVTCGVVVALDRSPSLLELLAPLVPAVAVGVLGVRQARPQKTQIDRSTCALWARGVRLPLDPPALILTRRAAGAHAFHVTLVMRHAGTVVRLRGVRANEAARTKAIAVALAAWLDGSLLESTSRAAVDALHDADARHGLVLPRPTDGEAAVPDAPSRRGGKLETVVDVAAFSVELLNAL